MAGYDDELLEAADLLLVRMAGRRGKLSNALVRRSISTSYYAIFHFLLEETGERLIGTHDDLRRRRRVLVRTLSHAGLRTALLKMRGSSVDRSVDELFRLPSAPVGPVPCPSFIQGIAQTFLDAQAKREDADYDLNAVLSETDARLLLSRVKHSIAGWRVANTAADRDFKLALVSLFLLKGQLRKDV